MRDRFTGICVAQFFLLGVAVLLFCGCSSPKSNTTFQQYTVGYDNPVDPELQRAIEGIDAQLRAKFDIKSAQISVGVLDLNHLQLAFINPDRGDYAASVAKIGILLAYFQMHPEAATHLDPKTRHELGLMIKASSNEMAAKFSHKLGLKNIQQVINSYQFYDKDHGGGLWVGRHYGGGSERYGDPVGDNSHAATARQLVRFYLMLEQNKLVSPEASKTMREIFASPDIPHDDIKFVKALKDRHVQIRRKWGTWENWHHDTALITGPGRRYILVGMTNNPKGDDYLEELARSVDDLMIENSPFGKIHFRLEAAK